jgi:SAM-dependent methyltransferase
MSTVFGEVADLYDRARSGYPAQLADVALAFAGRPPSRAAEVGAGTGKGTALFAGRGSPITCIEPDERMSELLRDRFPEVAVATTTFEQWAPPDRGVDLLFSATAWHWVDPARRAMLAARALAPGGTVALIGRSGGPSDSELDRQIEAAFERFPPAAAERPPLPTWAVPELRATGSFAEITVHEVHEDVAVPTDRFLERTQTMSPFRRRTPEDQKNLLNELREIIEAHGGTVPSRTVISLVLARKAGG